MSIDMENDEFVRAKVNVKITPGEMLKTIRELQELTQSELSEMTGITQSNISALENNTRNLGRERAIVFAKALKVHPSVLIFPDFDMASVA